MAALSRGCKQRIQRCSIESTNLVITFQYFAPQTSLLLARTQRLSLSMLAEEGGKEKTGGDVMLCLLFFSFPRSLALRHQSLAFHARLCAKNEAPGEAAVFALKIDFHMH